jgi:hypothetical protein
VGAVAAGDNKPGKFGTAQHTGTQNCIAREVSVEVFILNCSAVQMVEWMVDNKRTSDVRNVMADKYKQQRMFNELSPEEDEPLSSARASTDGIATTDDVATVEWPPAVEAVSELEQAIAAVENEVANLEAIDSFEQEFDLVKEAVQHSASASVLPTNGLGDSIPPKTAKSTSDLPGEEMAQRKQMESAERVWSRSQNERTALLAKLCRLWGYFQMALEIPHGRTLSEAEFERRRRADFAALHVFGLAGMRDALASSPTGQNGNEILPDVEASMARIEFLFDRAELHIREAQLCFHGNETSIITFVESVVNTYLAKIVSNLGYFFEANTGIRYVKVVSSEFPRWIYMFMRFVVVGIKM